MSRNNELSITGDLNLNAMNLNAEKRFNILDDCCKQTFMINTRYPCSV